MIEGLTLLAIGIFSGWVLRGFKPRIVYQITENNVRAWLQAMDEKERSLILYPLVKSVYYGRRTIHRCPENKGKTTNLLKNL